MTVNADSTWMQYSMFRDGVHEVLNLPGIDANATVPLTLLAMRAKLQRLLCLVGLEACFAAHTASQLRRAKCICSLGCSGCMHTGCGHASRHSASVRIGPEQSLTRRICRGCGHLRPQLLPAGASATHCSCSFLSYSGLLQVVGTLRPEVAESLGLSKDVQVAPGSGDNQMSALGSGGKISGFSSRLSL